MRTWAVMVALAVALPVACLRAEGAEGGSRELWYELFLRDQHCGWMRTVEDREDGNPRSITQTHLRLDRAGQGVTVEIGSEFVETPEGKPIRMTLRTATGGPAVVTEYRFIEGGGQVDQGGAAPPPGTVKTTIRQGAQTRESVEPWPQGAWLPPRAAERFFAERRAAGAKEVVYETLDGQAGLTPGTVTCTLMGRDEIQLPAHVAVALGGPAESKRIPVTRWRVVNSLVPVESMMILSSDGAIVSTSTMLGAERLESRLSTRERAKGIVGAGPELMLSIMVKPDRPLPGVERSKSMVYRVSVPDGTLPDLPTSGAQRFTRLDERSGTLHVTLDDPQRAALEDATRAEYIKPSATIESDDALVRQLMEKALRGRENETPAKRAERLRQAVAAHITGKGLATAFASAAETARSREGDCSEHAVLLAALLRAAGIPSRVAVGLVYVDQFAGSRDVFGWHMWTQALVPASAAPAKPGDSGNAGMVGDAGTLGEDGGQATVWLDLDATLPGSTAYHAGHILTGVSDLAAGPTDPALGQMIPLLGRLRIQAGQ
jgi:hypothetical protein